MLRILVVDDDRHVRTAITTALDPHRYDVLAVENGHRALNAFRQGRFDAAIVDVFMLEMDGMTLINALRDRSPTLPIIVISGGADGAVALDTLRTAPDRSRLTLLAKPFRRNQLIQVIEEAVR
jgi:CheY-like chemotaxis protein